jgi:cytochrome oxidase assembly protein ShyY1
VYRFLASPRWIGLAIVAVAVAIACVQLGRWQLHRHEQRRAFNHAVTSNLSRPPVPVHDVLSAEHPLPSTDEWRRLTVRGRYDTSHQMFVRNRTFEGQVGFEVLTPVIPADGGPAVLVDRGWVHLGRSSLQNPQVPPPPAGTVTITGRARPGEGASGIGPAEANDLPAGQINQIDVPFVADRLPYPVADGYLELTAQTPTAPGQPARVPAPELGLGPHLAYTVQWWLFAVVAIVGYAMLARGEARERADRS